MNPFPLLGDLQEDQAIQLFRLCEFVWVQVSWFCKVLFYLILFYFIFVMSLTPLTQDALSLANV